MKKAESRKWKAEIGVLCAVLLFAQGTLAQPVPPTTPFSRDWLTSTNAAQGRDKLGVTGTGGGATNAYNTIQEDGTPLSARTTLNFTGAGLTATDNPGNTRTDLALDADLNALAALSTAADRLAYFTGAGSAALSVFTAFARGLLDDATAAEARATLGVTATADLVPTNGFLLDITPEQYGAKVDDGVDDTAAWSNAVRAVNLQTGGTNRVRGAKGVYDLLSLSAPLVITNHNVWTVGQGSVNGTTLRVTNGAAKTFLVANDGTVLFGGGMSRFGIDGPNTNGIVATGYGIHLGKTNGDYSIDTYVVDDVLVREFGTNFALGNIVGLRGYLRAYNAESVDVRVGRLDSSRIALQLGYHDSAGGYNPVYGYTSTNSYTTSYGLLADNANSGWFTLEDLEVGRSGKGMHFLGVSIVDIDNANFERQAGPAITISNSTTRLTISGKRFATPDDSTNAPLVRTYVRGGDITIGNILVDGYTNFLVEGIAPLDNSVPDVTTLNATYGWVRRASIGGAALHTVAFPTTPNVGEENTFYQPLTIRNGAQDYGDFRLGATTNAAFLTANTGKAGGVSFPSFASSGLYDRVGLYWSADSGVGVLGIGFRTGWPGPTHIHFGTSATDGAAAAVRWTISGVGELTNANTNNIGTASAPVGKLTATNVTATAVEATSTMSVGGVPVLTTAFDLADGNGTSAYHFGNLLSIDGSLVIAHATGITINWQDSGSTAYQYATNASFTTAYSGSPPEGALRSLVVSNSHASAWITNTIPSTYSFFQKTNITALRIAPKSKMELNLRYLAGQYELRDAMEGANSNLLYIAAAAHPGTSGISLVTTNDPVGGFTFSTIGGAPSDAEYFVGAANGTLSAERVGTDTATVDVDTGTAAQVKLHVLGAGVTNLQGHAWSYTIQTVASGATNYILGLTNTISTYINPGSGTNVHLRVSNLEGGNGSVNATIRFSGANTLAIPTNYVFLNTNGFTISGTNFITAAQAAGKVIEVGFKLIGGTATSNVICSPKLADYP